MPAKLTAEQALNMVWASGAASLLNLTPVQEEIYGALKNAKDRVAVVDSSRQIGKSYGAVSFVDSFARTHGGARIKYAAPTGKQVLEITIPHFDSILRDCPRHMRPQFYKQDLAWVYPSGSRIKAAGCDNGHANDLRGTAMDLGVIDEAAFIDCLEYLIEDVLIPQTITCDGVIWALSTPPESAAHPWGLYCSEAKRLNSYIKRTIYDATHIPPNVVAEYKARAMRRGETTWRREYLAEHVTDENNAVIPEWTAERAEKYTREWPQPEYRDCYAAMDLGYVDLTVCLFGYWDFQAAKLIIEDELVLTRPTSEAIAAGVREKEATRWGMHAKVSRWSDNELLVLNDLATTHHIHFQPTAKDDKEAQVNAVRLAVLRGEIIIHPRCVTLLAHLSHAIWNKAKTKFERSGQFGHFDAVDALVYLVRNVNRNKNPYPDIDPLANQYTHHLTAKKPEHPTAKTLSQAFRRHLP